MDAVDRILIPTDGSPNSKAAMEQGLSLAKSLKKPVLGLYVIDDAALDAFRSEAIVADMTGILRREADAALAELKARALKLGLKAVTEVREGHPAEEIVAAATPHDLIVLSTHGRRGLSRLLLGSIAESVVRHAPGPVLVIRPNQKASP